MNKSSLPLRGGPIAWQVRVNGQLAWVARSKGGRVLKGLYSTEDKAMAAVKALDEFYENLESYAEQKRILDSDSCETFIVKDDKGGKFIAVWDVRSEEFLDEIYPYRRFNRRSVQRLQRLVRSLEDQEASPDEQTEGASSASPTP